MTVNIDINQCSALLSLNRFCSPHRAQYRFGLLSFYRREGSGITVCTTKVYSETCLRMVPTNNPSEILTMYTWNSMTNLQLEQCIEIFRSSYIEMQANYDKYVSAEIRYEGFKPYRIAAETNFMQMVEKSTLEYEEFLSCAFHRLLEVPTSTSCNKIEVDSFADLPVIFQSKFIFLFWVINAFPPKKDIIPLLCFVADE